MAEALATWWVRRGFWPGKLSPPLPHALLRPRPRVTAALDEQAAHPIVRVDGPAGAGKTVAVAQWLASTARASAWLTLDASDADPATLVRHVLAALAGPGWVPEPPAWPQPHEPIDARAWWIEHVVLPLAVEGPPVVLVLDDVHALERDPSASGTAVAALGALLRDRPPRLQLVLVGRELPTLALARLEAAGAVGRLPTRTLWLTLAEASASLEALLGPAGSPALSARLHARSGGWPAALRLLALTVRTPGLDHAPHEALSDAPAVSSSRAIDFVVEEVIDPLDPQQRGFLLDAAVLEPLMPEVYEALGERHDVERMLWALVDAGLLVAAGQGMGFRVQPLLREALERRLDATRRGPLHARASRCLAANDRLDAALAHARASGDTALLVELAAAHGFALLRARRMGQLGRLLAAIDEPTRRASPLVATLAAWVALREPPPQAREALERAREALAALELGSPARVTLEASLMALDTFVSLRLGQAPADLDERLVARAELPTGLAVALAVGAGLVAERAGEVVRALARYDRGARLALAADPPLPSGLTALAHRARVLRRAGRVDEARRALEDGEAASARLAWSGLPVAAELALEHAMLELDAGELAAAEERTTTALHALELGDDPATVARGLLGLATIRRARGDAEGAAGAAARAEAVARAAGIAFLVAAAQAVLEPAGPAGAVAAVSPAAEGLSPRELEVLELVAQGSSNQLVGRRLFIAPVTVKTHVHNILTKLGARNRTEAVHKARALGLLR